MNIPVFAALAVAGLLSGPLLRAAILRHEGTSDQGGKVCPRCATSLTGRTRLLTRMTWSGRCPQCQAPIGPPAGSVETVAATVFATLAWRIADPLTLLGLVWAAGFAVVLSFIDVEVHRLPNRLVLSALGGTAVALSAAAWHSHDGARLGMAGWCAAGTVVAYLVLALVPSGFGLGDVKASALSGLCAGWFGAGATALAFTSGLILGGLAAILLLTLRQVSSGSSLAHGPFMFTGALLAVIVFGGQLNTG